MNTPEGSKFMAHVRRLAADGVMRLYVRIDRADVARLRLAHGQKVEVDLARKVRISGVVKTSGGSPWLAPPSNGSNSAITTALRGAGFEHGADVLSAVRVLGRSEAVAAGAAVQPPAAPSTTQTPKPTSSSNVASPVYQGLPEEVDSPEKYPEGSVKTISVNFYERNAKARRSCIEHYGTKCVVCGFDFAEVYGPEAEGFIHVHHLVPLSRIGESYEVDPIEDLRPVCPNCHAFIHLGGGFREIDSIALGGQGA